MIVHCASGCRVPVLSGLICLYVLLGECESRCFSDDRLQSIIENVRQNESLYTELDVRLRETYRIGDHAPVVSSDGTEEIISKDKAIHYVTQSGMFRLDIEGTSHTKTGPSVRDRIRAFDGTTTRLFDQDVVGNIITGRSDDDNAVRPHMLLMRYSFLMIPLSTLLSGDEAIAAHPAGKPSANSVHSIRYDREDEFRGRPCHVVTVASVSKSSGEERSRREYWLAEDRNYIPVRLLNYTYRASRDIHSGEDVVEEFTEISPGVWFPTLASFTAYDKLQLGRDGQQRLKWREDYVVQEASLDPNYDMAYFRDIEFSGKRGQAGIRD